MLRDIEKKGSKDGVGSVSAAARLRGYLRAHGSSAVRRRRAPETLKNKKRLVAPQERREPVERRALVQPLLTGHAADDLHGAADVLLGDAHLFLFF